MIAGGISLQGRYHSENQDFFWCRAEETACALSVSDGLGSKPRSAAGSRAFCACMRELFSAPLKMLPDDPKELCRGLHMMWLEHLEDIPAEECCATALFAIAHSGTLLMGALGDGCIAARTDQGRITVLRDGKPDCFSNETDCLRDVYEPDAWRVRKIPFQTLEGIVAMTDGIELFPNEDETLERFAGELFDAYRTMDEVSILADVQKWLSAWPGTDDKTIAFCIAGDGQNGCL